MKIKRTPRTIVGVLLTCAGILLLVGLAVSDYLFPL